MARRCTMLKHLHRLSPHAGGMRTALLGVCHYLHKWKAWAKSCHMQQPKYNLGIHGAAPTMNPILSSPYVAPLKMPGSHCGVLLGQQNQMFYTHSSDFCSSFDNRNSQSTALDCKDRACLEKGRNCDARRFPKDSSCS